MPAGMEAGAHAARAGCRVGAGHSLCHRHDNGYRPDVAAEVLGRVPRDPPQPHPLRIGAGAGKQVLWLQLRAFHARLRRGTARRRNLHRLLLRQRCTGDLARRKRPAAQGGCQADRPRVLACLPLPLRQRDGLLAGRLRERAALGGAVRVGGPPPVWPHRRGGRVHRPQSQPHARGGRCPRRVAHRPRCLRPVMVALPLQRTSHTWRLYDLSGQHDRGYARLQPRQHASRACRGATPREAPQRGGP